MAAQFPPDSAGLVIPQTAYFTEPLALDCGRALAGYEIVYETYGTLNASSSNAILICHALSGDHHVAGFYEGGDPSKPGWWDNCIGPGKPLASLSIPANSLWCAATTWAAAKAPPDQPRSTRKTANPMARISLS